MATQLTPKELALRFGTTPKNLRKFLRSDAKGKGLETPGKGSRWAIPANQAKALQKRFDAWNAAKAVKAEEAVTEVEAPEAPDAE